jgi:sugar-phosphatase
LSTSHRVLDKTYDAFLFDMDGTVLNSIAVVERVWSEWALRHGFEPEVLLKTIHGVRASDAIRQLGLPGVDPVAEAKQLLKEEMEDFGGIVGGSSPRRRSNSLAAAWQLQAFPCRK